MGDGTQQAELEARRERVARNIGIGFIVLCVVIVITGVVWPALHSLLQWYLGSPKEDLSISNRKDLVQGFASVGQAVAVLFTGLVALLGLLLTRRSTQQQLQQARESTQLQLDQARQSTEQQLKQARESTEQQLKQARESQRETVRLTEEGQITDRFTQAIEQLGSDKLEIRLGGIYALERIAKDSKKDALSIMEVLTTYVREHAPYPPRERSHDDTFISPPTSQARRADAAESQPTEADEAARPRADIQTILTVLGRSFNQYDKDKGTGRLDLRWTDLRRAQLIRARLEGAMLLGASLRGVRLNGAYLDDALLNGADLEDAWLENAHLNGTLLIDARLKGARLHKARLSGARLHRARLEGVDLTKVTGLTQKQIERASGDRQTKLPERDGLDRPAQWDRDPEAERADQNEPPGQSGE